MNLYTKFCLLNWSFMRWSVLGTSFIGYPVHQAQLHYTCSFNWRQNRMCWAAINWLPRLTPWHLLSHNHHVIVWTNQSQADVLQSRADVLRLSPCVIVKLNHVDCSTWKMLMPPTLNTGFHNTKTEPIAAQLAILPPPYLWLNFLHSYLISAPQFQLLGRPWWLSTLLRRPHV